MEPGDSEPVVVFPTCLVDAARPAVGAASMRLVRSVGGRPALAAGATCCGQPAFNAGFVADARRVATRTVRALTALPGPVVVPSGSCATMLRRHVPDILRDSRWAQQADSVAARVVELSRFMADRMPRPPVPAPTLLAPTLLATTQPRPCVTYHDSCHMLRELKEQDSPRQVLAAAGYEIREMPGRERCCGFGGTFAVSLPAISVAMADEKLDEAVDTGAGTLAGADVSCLLHLSGRAHRRGLPLQVRHLAELLDPQRVRP